MLIAIWGIINKIVLLYCVNWLFLFQILYELKDLRQYERFILIVMFKFVNVNKDFSPHVNDPPPQLIIFRQIHTQMIGKSQIHY